MICPCAVFVGLLMHLGLTSHQGEQHFVVVRATTKQQVLNGINKLTLQTNEHGQYTHNAILLLQKGVQQVLISQFNPSNPGEGMVKLLDNGANILT
jgi:hypothetical protein